MTSAPGQRIRTPTDLGLVIRERRRALRLDQRTLASRVGVSRQWIVEIEQGKARAGVGLVLRTLQALGLEPRVMIGEGGESPPGRPTSLDDAIDIDAIVEKARGRAGAVPPRVTPPAESKRATPAEGVRGPVPSSDRTAAKRRSRRRGRR